MVLVFCATGGRFPWWGGSSEPSVPRFSGVSPQKGRAAHGPRHPAVNIRLGICKGLCPVCCVVIQLVFFRFDVTVFSFSGVGMVSVVSALPILAYCLCPSFSLFVWFVRRCRVLSFFSLSLSFSLSFSQALWKPKPLLGGLGFPLFFFVLAEHSALDPYFVIDTYTTATPSPCFFSSLIGVARLSG